MPHALPSCFSGRSAVGPPATTAVGPSQATSVYATGLGVAALTWTRTVLGLLVGVDLRLDDGETLSFKIRPWLLWKRKGSRKLHLKNRLLDLAWDLSRAVFPASGCPEPESGYFLSVAVDGDLHLVAGDLETEARRKTKMIPIEKTVLLSRREHVATGSELSYTTTANFGGKRRSIAINLDGEMNLAVDGKRILQIRRLRWKFRGSERVELGGGGDRIQISWDLHNWMFPAKKDDGEREDEDRPHAKFMFRFEGEGHFGNSECFEYLGKNWSESGSDSSGGERKGKARREKEGKRKSLVKTSSSSSSSSASSGGSSTVMEWWSKEEEELQSRRGFTLLVYAWKE